MAVLYIKAILLYAISCACLMCLYALCGWQSLFGSATYGLHQVLDSHCRRILGAMCLTHIIRGAMQHEDAGRNPDSPLHKRQRHVWTSEAHHEFCNIVKALGDSK